ncbi:hypothetical protein OUZ56_014934 [Daphnia magna]|uniref:Uncharacterized protein n=1 Tax=Daphnia magna TaxID=35525 RepID=A0ABR0ALA8_9CRUS|nr:hypothetical protein OUZ56_014934 [Daphnia magna]
MGESDSVFGEDQDRTCTTLDVSEPNRLAMFNQSDCGTGIETDYVGIATRLNPDPESLKLERFSWGVALAAIYMTSFRSALVQFKVCHA